MTNDINNFLQSMVEAKRALDNEPILLATIREHEGHIHRLGETVANRELHIHNLKQSEVTLTRKIREVEAERDETFRLAAEEGDKATAMLALLRNHVQEALQTIAAVSGGEALAVVPEGERQERLSLQADRIALCEQIDKLNHRLEAASIETSQLKNELAEAKTPFVPTTMEPHHPFAGEALSLQSEAMGSSTGGISSFEGSGDTPNYMVQSASPNNALAGEQVVHDESGFSAGFSVGEPYATLTGSGPSTDVADPNAKPLADASGPLGEGVSVSSDPTASSSLGAQSGTAGEDAPASASSPSTDRVALGPNPSRSGIDPNWPDAFSRASHQS